MTCEYLSRLYIRFLDLLKWAYFPRSGLPQVFHGVRNLVPNLRVLPFFLAMLGGEGTKGPVHRRIRREILWEVLCLLYRHLHRLIFIIWTQQETGKSLSKLGRITRLPWSCTRNPKTYTQLATLLALIGAEARKVFATFTKPLLQHDVIARPCAKLTADLCELHGRILLVVTAYFSNYIEVARPSVTSTQAVVRQLKTMFARLGISEILVTDNGP